MDRSSVQGLSRDDLARVVAQDIDNGWYVNLGIGIPEKVANHISADKEVILHSENGILGMGGAVPPELADSDLINAGKRAISLKPGGCFFDHVDSFAMMRGGHLDLCILGAFQVSVNGDLANWWTGDKSELPAVGGAMDLVAGARRVFVMMDHVTRSGAPKIVRSCTYPLTGRAAVHRIYTNLAVIRVTTDGLVLDKIVEDLTVSELQSMTDVPLTVSENLSTLTTRVPGVDHAGA